MQSPVLTSEKRTLLWLQDQHYIGIKAQAAELMFHISKNIPSCRGIFQFRREDVTLFPFPFAFRMSSGWGEKFL